MLKQNRVARLLVRTDAAPGPVLYGCVLDQRRARRLDVRVDGVRPGTGRGPVLAGHWALYRVRDDFGSELVRVDLRTGRHRIIDRLYAKDTLHTTDGYVLKPNGSLSWITSTSLQAPVDYREVTMLRQVLVAERGSRVREVDRATYRAFTEPDPIPDRFLRLSRDGRRLQWRSNGQLRRIMIS